VQSFYAVFFYALLGNAWKEELSMIVIKCCVYYDDNSIFEKGDFTLISNRGFIVLFCCISLRNKSPPKSIWILKTKLIGGKENG